MAAAQNIAGVIAAALRGLSHFLNMRCCEWRGAMRASMRNINARRRACAA
jgi:hypothetical protein